MNLLTAQSVGTLVIGLGFLFLAIIESVYLDEYNNEKVINLCWNIWINLLISCFLNYVTFILSSTAFVGILNGKKELILLPITALIIGMMYRTWTCAIYVNIDGSCSDEYKSDAPELLKLLDTELCIFSVMCSFAITILGCFIMMIAIVFCSECCKSRAARRSARIDRFSSLASLGFPGARMGRRVNEMLKNYELI